MSRNVIIFGAGSSLRAGVPVMNNFFDKAEDLYIAGKFAEDKELIARTFQCIDFLQKVYSKSNIDLRNLEQVFGLIELGSLLDLRYKQKELFFNEYRDSIIRLIIRTIEESVDYKGSQEAIGDYGEISSLINQGKLSETTFISFNYDCYLDLTLAKNKLSFRYCLKDDHVNDGFYSHRSEFDTFKILKLHGSLNWTLCSDSKESKDLKVIPLTKFSEYETKTGPNDIVRKLSISKIITEKKNSEEMIAGKYKIVEDNPFIVPPTWNKLNMQPELISVWKQAAKAFSEAQNIVVIGYSLPETDVFFKYLYALGSISSARIRKFLVFNPDQSVEAKFKQLLGQGVVNQFKFSSAPFKGVGEALINEKVA